VGSNTKSRDKTDLPALVEWIVVVKEETDAPPVTPVAPPAASSAPSAGGDLPEEFSLETFISWLEGKGAGTASKGRRHARSFMA